ncbi:N-acetylglucosaminyldiphosphoundecaprenol N-acetyl-beta-D-mannosaminyltransferase [Paenibacillus uliginis N3/975]|uniref:N-acetylglucosaminyldiphosphoundecaprenol N-acetyl-beta-D-mannosaminyltransferase n=1 Tax=Paenibacillus uliginis N3/975 TaxID=1313296 RepID=A0A1X7GB38_9BACL|nr:WecB/TagA/CpsF family glycosyltransferase [Paenibacillus uliginis]SMF67033.1 N-acetylglucosaminyldiphosphoundecaprenol N-acetyl-beta-D-mannosaminyltransferase [Paenibacillus uliginis N3/975]
MKQTTTIPSVSIFGIPFSKLNMNDTVKHLTEAVISGRPHQVITANPIMVMAALDDPEYKKMMQNADLIVPDGSGIVWAAGVGGDPLTERVTGFDMLHELMKVGENYRWKFYLLGTTPEVIQEAAERLQMQYPAAIIAGYRDGFFGPEQDDEVIEGIRAVSPDLLFVARGADTQEPWIARYKERLGVPVMMGVGGSFDIISGKSKRAPKVFQKLRLEWFYRLLKEPTRFKRMLALPKFAVKVLREKEKVTKTN